MSDLPHHRLGRSELEVSVLSLGSWRTFERISPDEGKAVMAAAREAGITFLDDARYDDESGTAPIPTGYSEVVFGQLFRASGWDRERVVVANKLWWEHWPEQWAIEELDGSLDRMGLDHVDLIYAMPPPDGLAMEDLIDHVTGLITSGRARAWGTGMWSAAQHHQALDICRRNGVDSPVAAQMATSLVDSVGPDEPEMRRAFDEGPIGLVASYTLAGGTLTGKYLSDPASDGRAVDDDRGPIGRGKALAARVVDLARQWGVPPAHVAMAHALGHPNLASVVFGARSRAQLEENVGSVATFAGLDDEQLAQVAELAEAGRPA